MRRPPEVPHGRNVSVTLGAASRRALGAAQPGGRSGSGPEERRSAVAVRGRRGAGKRFAGAQRVANGVEPSFGVS